MSPARSSVETVHPRYDVVHRLAFEGQHISRRVDCFDTIALQRAYEPSAR